MFYQSCFIFFPNIHLSPSIDLKIKKIFLGFMEKMENQACLSLLYLPLISDYNTCSVTDCTSEVSYALFLIRHTCSPLD